jgi:alkylation response protein AidB-like acyl-CoA dehydrogenase
MPGFKEKITMTSYQELQGFAKPHLKAAHIIQSDAEALEIATKLSQQFKQSALERDANRDLPFTQLEAYSQSGLWAITVPTQYGGQRFPVSPLPK